MQTRRAQRDDSEDEAEEAEEEEEETERTTVRRRVKRRRKRTSNVWDTFAESEKGYRCARCGRVYNLTTSTASLKYHLKKEHEFGGSRR